MPLGLINIFTPHSKAYATQQLTASKLKQQTAFLS
tara:strand:+ start:4147 stop:4251 length:105 start_codon:yes stop_codon:yes gene_type:complete